MFNFDEPKRTPAARLYSLLFIALLFAAAWFLSAAPYRYGPDNVAQLRLSFRYTSETTENCRELTEEERAKQLAHMRRDVICNRERLPTDLLLQIDGETIIDRTLQPTGFRNDGPASAYLEIPVPPGRHKILVQLSSGDKEIRFDRDILFGPQRVVALDFDRQNLRFVVVSRIPEDG